MIHVLFSSSAAGTLRQVLRASGHGERVVDLTECLNWGPIGGDFASREEWFADHVPGDRDDWNWLAEHGAEFRERIVADADRLVWLAPRSASELAGFHWYLQEFGQSDTKLLIADYSMGMGGVRDDGPKRLGMLNTDAMSVLLDNAPRTSWDRDRFPLDRWQELVSDKALLRIVDAGELRSAPENLFDTYLLDRCPAEWTDPLRVIGNTMSDVWDAGHDIGDAFLLWRLRELVRTEHLRCDGELRWGAGSRNGAQVRRP